MTAPTGYSPDARTLLKTITYELEAVPPSNYPAPENVFRDVRASYGTLPDYGTPVIPPIGATKTNPVDGSTYTILNPSWGGGGIVLGNPPLGSSLVI